MATEVTIPSPSVFLRPDSPKPAVDTAQAKAVKHARRPSPPQAKKKAARKAAGPVTNGADNAVIKPKQSKSRDGCATCKSKRLKCGEEKPGCKQCQKRNVPCGGYKKEFKWRTFEETNVKVRSDGRKRGNSPKQSSSELSKPVTPVSEKLPKTVAELKRGEVKAKKKDSVIDGDGPLAERFRHSLAFEQKEDSPFDENQTISPTSEQSELAAPPLIPDATPSSYAENFNVRPEDVHPGSLSHFTPGLGLSPTLTETLLPWNADDQMHQDFINYSLPEGFQQVLAPSHPMTDVMFEDEDMPDEEIEELIRRNHANTNLPLMLTSRHCSPSSMPPESPGDLFDHHMGYIYPQPCYEANSPEMLTLRFDRITCGILSINDGLTENPWRSLIWPLARKSLALYHAITAMTAFHGSNDEPELRVVGHVHKAASIRYTVEGLQNDSFTMQTAIAVALALGFAECWDTHTQTGNTHVKGAQQLIRRALRNHRLHPWKGDDLKRLKFLCNAWVFSDVITRLTAVDPDITTDYDNTLLLSDNPNHAPKMVMGDTEHGFGIDFGMPIDARLDPLMGCASTLFPIIGRVANLVRRVCRSEENSPDTISQAKKMMRMLKDWYPPEYIETPEDTDTDVEDTVQTAEAYRWATLLHLHQAVPELPGLFSTPLAQAVWSRLATVELDSRTIIIHIYPLMVAGCEAVNEDDRNWVRTRWNAMSGRMRVGTVDKCAAVTEEVWRRRDAYEAQPSSNRKLVATADLQRSRQRGPPLVRTPTGGVRPGDPGTTGMVFTYVTNDNGSVSDDETAHRRAKERLRGRDPGMRAMDDAYTVRGPLHWIGVMWDWGWEVLL